MKLAGVDLYDAYSAIDTYTETGQNENRIGGIILLVSQLKQGQPVMVGVAQTTKEGQFVKVLNSDGKTPSNRNTVTSHFVVVRSAKVDVENNTVSFNYLDNRTSRGGKSPNNNFTLQTNGLLIHLTPPTKYTYTVSEVRKNK